MSDPIDTRSNDLKLKQIKSVSGTSQAELEVNIQTIEGVYVDPGDENSPITNSPAWQNIKSFINGVYSAVGEDSPT